MRIQEVPIQLVNRVWPSVEHYIGRALSHSNGEYTANDAKVLVSLGQWSLIVAMDDANHIHGAATVQYFNRPNDRVAFVTAIGGRNIVNANSLLQLEGIIKSNGATCWESAVRPSMERMLNGFGAVRKYSIVGAKVL